MSLATVRLFLTLVLPVIGASTLHASQLLSDYEERTTVHVLENGWTFVIVEQPGPPTVSFTTVVDAGSAREVPGITGVAHMFEHMAFKGTTTIGTLDYQAEKAALRELERSYEAYHAERTRTPADSQRLEATRAAFEAHQKQAAALARSSAFAEIISREGGVGLNAATNRDFTIFTYSLPANKLELFAYLESERFRDPVFREFYKERDVVREERRQTVDNRPLGRLVEQSVAVAFVAHPYNQPVLGHMSDLESITIRDARAFYREHYVPANMVTAIVGRIRAEDAIPLLEEHFGRLPKGDKPPPLATVEEPQIAEKSITILDDAQPLYAEMYHRPSVLDPDEAVYTAIDDILSKGRTSRLYRSLVRDHKAAAFVGSFTPFPGMKYPNLWLVVSIPAKDFGPEDVQALIRDELERLKREPVTDTELLRFRTRAKARLLRELRSHDGFARQIATAQLLFGDWRELFRSLDRIERVTPADVQRVAQRTFVPSNRTTTVVKPPPETKTDSPSEAP